MEASRSIMIVSGEPSGDGHASKLVKELLEIEPKCFFFGAAGPRMRDVGVEAVVRSDELSVVGLVEIGRALPMFLRAANDLKAAAIERRPEVVILVDFPDFNLKLAKSLKKKGFRVVYYISPQLWAWRKYRISTIKKYVDLLIAILPFEKQWYAEHGVDHVEFVGNPLANEVHTSTDKHSFCNKHLIDPTLPIVALLPGSRHKEIVRILPVMLTAANKIECRIPAVQFVIAAADERSRSEIEKILVSSRSSSEKANGMFNVIENETYDILNASDAAAVASGTATLETGIIGTPMTIVYKTSAINYKLLKPLIDVEHYGLINLIAEERIATELIQDEFTADSLSDEICRLLDPVVNAKMREKLAWATDKLGHGGASKRAAEAILRLLNAGG